MTSEPVTMSDGSVLWFTRLLPAHYGGPLTGKRVLHREDGPAVERPNGDCSWWWRGVKLTFDMWAYEAKPTNAEMAFYVLKYFKA